MGLKIEGLNVNYDASSVIWDLSAEIPAGKLTGVIGPNGAGKSTFLKVCAGLIKPISGRVELYEQPLSKSVGRIVYVPQRESIDWDFPITAIELVLMGRYGKLGPLKWPRKADKMAAMEALKMVQMEKFHDRQIGQLSGGQQQRLFIARALLQEGDLYLFDEPFAAIDALTEKVLIKLFQRLKKEKKHVLVVHHDLSSAKEYFDHVLLLNTGLIASGSPRKVLTEKNLKRAYGSGFSILEKAAKLDIETSSGDLL